MEVCGTHTVAISRFGIRRSVPKNLNLLSGPGCPVCVTPNEEIDWAIEITKRPDTILATFGDMMKVPGSYSSLTQEKSRGAAIKVCYSTLDALKLAQENPEKKVVFFGVGFETTTPSVAHSIIQAKNMNLKNYYVYSAHKTVPEALKALAETPELNLDGFILPGHVSSIIGSRPYEFVPKEYKLACVISGFEPLDILQSLTLLIKQVKEKSSKVENNYKRVVREEGNLKALEVMYEVFEQSDAKWRGLGVIPGSGLKIKEDYEEFDASKTFSYVEVPPVKEHKSCRCGEVLTGMISPFKCPLFAKACTPEHPVGPCMVSSEGSCAAYYRYESPLREAKS
jgi:hydrogenase expression/formation protein HypD